MAVYPTAPEYGLTELTTDRNLSAPRRGSRVQLAFRRGVRRSGNAAVASNSVA